LVTEATESSAVDIDPFIKHDRSMSSMTSPAMLRPIRIGGVLLVKLVLLGGRISG
jgi:hypothetical protein